MYSGVQGSGTPEQSQEREKLVMQATIREGQTCLRQHNLSFQIATKEMPFILKAIYEPGENYVKTFQAQEVQVDLAPPSSPPEHNVHQF